MNSCTLVLLVYETSSSQDGHLDTTHTQRNIMKRSFYTAFSERHFTLFPIAGFKNLIAYVFFVLVSKVKHQLCVNNTVVVEYLKRLHAVNYCWLKPRIKSILSH